MRLLQSLSRGLKALDYMGEQARPVRLTDVANALGVEKSNAMHVLKTLVAGGYAEQDERRRYNATDKIVRPGRRQHGLEEIISCKEAWRPVLEHLTGKTGECSHMAVLVKSKVWYIDKIDSSLPLKVDHPIGSMAPLHCTALGKAFLAFGNAVPESSLEAHTPKTITSTTKLDREIEKIRTLGYAVDDEEFSQGIRCVARPIYDQDGAIIAAIGISGPTVRLDDARLAELGEMVRSVSLQNFDGQN